MNSKCEHEAGCTSPALSGRMFCEAHEADYVHDFGHGSQRTYATREDYAREVWYSLDAETQAQVLEDYDMPFGWDFLGYFTDNMDARNNGAVTFTRVEGGYAVEDDAAL